MFNVVYLEHTRTPSPHRAVLLTTPCKERPTSTQCLVPWVYGC